jgi:hypothetical protein
MNTAPAPRQATQRNLLFLSTPSLWPVWPFLPVMRRQPGKVEEYGVLYDCWTKAGRPGYRATVFLTNLFELPPTEDELLALPREVYDTGEEVYTAGWRVD